MNTDVPESIASVWQGPLSTNDDEPTRVPADHVIVTVAPVPEGAVNRSRRLVQQLFLGSRSITAAGKGLSRSWHGGAPNVRTISPGLDDEGTSETTKPTTATRLPAAVLVEPRWPTTAVAYAVEILPDVSQEQQSQRHRPRGHLFATISECR